MRPLKVTAFLSDSIARPPYLDAVIEREMSLHTGRQLGLHHDQMERAEYFPGLIPTPILRRRVAGSDWPIPLCSSPIFSSTSDTHHHYARRFDVEPELIAPEMRRVYMTNSGEFKSHRLPLRVQTVQGDRIIWFCAVADGQGKKEVRRLLRRVLYLGKKTSQGYGRVERWEVEDAEHNWSWVADSPAGPVLMRPMPLAAVKAMRPTPIGWRQSHGGVVPPYWASMYHVPKADPC